MRASWTYLTLLILLSFAPCPVRANDDDNFKLRLKACDLLLRSLPEEAWSEGMVGTANRMAETLEFFTSGYRLTALGAAGDGLFRVPEAKGLIAVRDIEFFSLCEHHMLPFEGKVSVAYIPQEHVLGLSKFARIVEVFARRLQVQERLTQQIADAIYEVTGARGVVVRVQAQHSCMKSRGVQKQLSTTLTEASAGGLQDLSLEERLRLWDSVK